jgi:hypothetical protein
MTSKNGSRFSKPEQTPLPLGALFIFSLVQEANYLYKKPTKQPLPPRISLVP